VWDDPIRWNEHDMLRLIRVFPIGDAFSKVCRDAFISWRINPLD